MWWIRGEWLSLLFRCCVVVSGGEKREEGRGLTVTGGRHVQTDMGDVAARLMGRKEAPTTIQDSVEGICGRVSSFRGCGGKGVMLMCCADRRGYQGRVFGAFLASRRWVTAAMVSGLAV